MKTSVANGKTVTPGGQSEEAQMGDWTEMHH